MWNDSRYGSKIMKRLWSDDHRSLLWQTLWNRVMTYQHEKILGSDESQFLPFSVDASLAEIDEQGIAHELDAMRSYMEDMGSSNMRYLHFGLTSSDIMDNADAIRITQSINILQIRLAMLIDKLSTVAIAQASIPTLGMTHLQPAEVTSLGYRWLNHVEELFRIFEVLPETLAYFPLSKDRSGAVGSGINLDLFSGGREEEMFRVAIAQTWSYNFGLDKPMANRTVSQTSSRANENQVLQQVSAIAIALARFAGNVRHLQMLGHLNEPHTGTKRHVGSSAMPHKSNPILSENISGLSKLVVQLVTSHSLMCCDQLLERTLDDSSLRRQVLPQVILYVDEMLDKAITIVSGWTFEMGQIKSHIENNLEGVFSSRILLGLIMAYPDKTRSDLYAVVQQHLKPGSDLHTIRDVFDYYHPKLRFYLQEQNIEDEFWDPHYLGDLPFYIASRASVISRKARISLIEDNANVTPG